MGKNEKKYRTFVNKPIEGKLSSGAQKRKAEIVKTSSKKPSQQSIKNSLKGAPSGSVAWGMSQKSNKWDKVGASYRKEGKEIVKIEKEEKKKKKRKK